MQRPKGTWIRAVPKRLETIHARLPNLSRAFVTAVSVMRIFQLPTSFLWALVGYQFILHLILQREIRMFRVQLTRGATCRTNTFECASSRVLPRAMRVMTGSIASSESVLSTTSAWGSDFDHSCSNYLRALAEAYRWSARIGPTPRPRIDSSTMIGSVRPRSSLGIFEATRERFAASDGPILVLHDTTEFSFKRGDVDAVGITRKCVAGKYRDGAIRYYAACGILMHSSLAVTTAGLPLGLAAIKFWNREKFKGTNALKKRINPTRVPIEEKESIRWLDNLR